MPDMTTAYTVLNGRMPDKDTKNRLQLYLAAAGISPDDAFAGIVVALDDLVSECYRIRVMIQDDAVSNGVRGATEEAKAAQVAIVDAAQRIQDIFQSIEIVRNVTGKQQHDIYDMADRIDNLTNSVRAKVDAIVEDWQRPLREINKNIIENNTVTTKNIQQINMHVAAIGQAVGDVRNMYRDVANIADQQKWIVRGIGLGVLVVIGLLIFLIFKG